MEGATGWSVELVLAMQSASSGLGASTAAAEKVLFLTLSVYGSSCAVD